MARHLTRANAQSPDQRAKERKVHEELGKRRPSLETLLAEGYELIDPLTQLISPEVFAALRAAREAQHLTLEEVSEKSGIDKSTLSRLETGAATNPTIGTLVRYANALGKRLSLTLID